MKSLSKCFVRACTQRYQPLGFYRDKTTFTRMRGDVLQTFSLDRSQYVPTCTMYFGIIPLCKSEPIHFGGTYTLDRFVVEQQAQYGGWPFEPGSDESIETCVGQLCEAIDLYLLPFFEKCGDCGQALAELLKLEELFECNRQKALYISGITDRAAPLQVRSLFDHYKYYMALKAHDYPYIQRFLKNQVNHYESSLRSFEQPSGRQPESVKERFRAARVEYTQLLERFEAGDYDYFDDMVKANESRTLEFLASYHPKILNSKSQKE